MENTNMQNPQAPKNYNVDTKGGNYNEKIEGDYYEYNFDLTVSNKSTEIAIKKLQIEDEKQITDRFVKAIEQLGSDKLIVRLGAISTLEQITKDSEKYYWTVVEILTAFVRENSSIKSNLNLEKSNNTEIGKIKNGYPNCSNCFRKK